MSVHVPGHESLGQKDLGKVSLLSCLNYNYCTHIYSRLPSSCGAGGFWQALVALNHRRLLDCSRMSLEMALRFGLGTGADWG